MKNLAKCKLCKSTIESFFESDYIYCKCGEIAISGGPQALYTYARDYSNFLRVDENGNEIMVKLVEEDKVQDEPKSKLNKTELIAMLDTMADNIENLPKEALTAPVTHYDLYSALVLISSLFKAKD